MRGFVAPAQGAWTQLFAATSPEVREKRGAYKGAYLMPVKKVTVPSGDGTDMGKARQLWETSERLVAEKLGQGSS